MAERQESGKEGISDKRETHLAVLSLFGSALIWGLIWYPYRLLRDAGIHGIVSSSVTCAIAFALGLLFFRRSFSRFTPSWALLLLALSSGVCNLGYVLATLTGDVLRVHSSIAAITPSRSRPDRGIILMECVTLNQSDDVLQNFKAKLLAFRRPT